MLKAKAVDNRNKYVIRSMPSHSQFSEVCISGKCNKHTLATQSGETRLFKIRGIIYQIPIYTRINEMKD